MIDLPETPVDLIYTEEHEWIKKEDGSIRYGITDYAQEELGDIVYVELPSEGENMDKGDVLGVVESVKTVSDLYSPVSGTIEEVNEELETSPEILNDDPFGDGWIAVIELDDPSELDNLMTAEEYELHIE